MTAIFCPVGPFSSGSHGTDTMEQTAAVLGPAVPFPGCAGLRPTAPFHPARHIGPGDGKSPVQLVDVKDVARFLALAIAQPLYGTFNTTGNSFVFRDFLDACNKATKSQASFTWIPQQFLHEHGLESDAVLHTFEGNFPFWKPDPKDQGLYRVSSAKAFGAGWHVRPFEETALDCLSDFYSGQSPRPNYLTAAREKEILGAWKSHKSS